MDWTALGMMLTYTKFTRVVTSCPLAQCAMAGHAAWQHSL